MQVGTSTQWLRADSELVNGGNLLAQMHAGLVAHLPLLARHPDGKPGFVIGLLQSSRISTVQIDKIDVVEGGRHRFAVQVIPDEVADKTGPQRPVGQCQFTGCPQAIHALGIGPQQGFGLCLQVGFPGVRAKVERLRVVTRLGVSRHCGATRRRCSCSSVLW